MSKADIILSNAQAYTADDTNPSAATVAVKGNKIIFVGPEDASRDLRSANTTLIDCQQKTLMPGIIDSHFHLFTGSRVTNGVDVRGIKDLANLTRVIQDYADQAHGDPWLMAYAASYSLPSSAEALTRQHLDVIIPYKPLVLFAHDMHALWLNTACLKETGLLHGSDNPALQGDMKFADDGSATGEIVESGLFIFATEYLPSDEAYILKGLKRALKTLASYGITSVHNMLGNHEQARIFRKLELANELTTKVYLPYHVEPSTPFENLATEALHLRSTYDSEMLRGGAVKFFADGVYDGKTALSLNGYPDDPHYFGESIFEPEHYKRLVTEADRLGFQVATHAVGNGAVRLALDAYEQAQRTNGKRDSRHRVEHIEVCHPDDIPRFKELGVIASMQPLHAPSSAADADLWLKYVHEDEWQHAFPIRKLRDAGAHVALGSDWNVVTMNPFISWHAAMNRQPWGNEGDVHFKQSLEEVLAGYTKDAAYTEFKESKKGQLKVGMLADIVLLSEDIFRTHVSELKNLTTELTMVDGKILYQQDYRPKLD